MNKFIKSTGPDPFLIDPNDFNPGFFGHLNALVDAITVLQNTGGGGPGGTPISVYNGVDINPVVTNLTRLTFTGNIAATAAGFGAVDINVPAFSVSDIPTNGITFNYLPQMARNQLLGRYSTGAAGDIQTITIGTGLNLSTSGTLTASGTGNVLSVSQGTGISVTGAATTPTVALATVGAASSGVALATISVDAYGRVTSASAGSINQVGLTLASTISVVPANPNDIANKSYVDNFAQGLKPKASARLATIGNTTLNGIRTVDGFVVADGDRILVREQTSAANNGVYVVVSGGPWTRADDYNSAVEAADGSFVFVREGTDNGGSGFVQITSVTNLGSDPITFAQFSAGGTYTNGVGLGLTSGNQFFLNNTLAGPAIPALPGTFGGAASIPTFDVNAQGRITSVQNTNALINLVTNVNNTGAAGSNKLPVANGGTNFHDYTTGDILYASSTSALAKLSTGGSGNNGKVLTVTAGIPSWANAPTGFTNPLGLAGDIIYAPANGTGGNPAAAAALSTGGAGNDGKVLKIVGGLPTWSTATGGAVGTVISFVVDGYGAPIVAPSPGVTVFVVKVPFTGAYTGLTIQSDLNPGAGTITLGVTGFTSGTVAPLSITGATNTATSPVLTTTVGSGAALTFTVTNSATSPVTKLFVNLTGTRS